MGDWSSDWNGPKSGVSPVTVLAQSAVAVPHTGDTNETILATIAVPANAIGRNGRLAISAVWSYTNSGNNKLLKIRFGASGSGLSGTAFLQSTATTSTVMAALTSLANRNAASSQVGGASGSTPFGQSSGTPVTMAIDTTAATEINITGQLALATETITLESYQVLLYPAI